MAILTPTTRQRGHHYRRQGLQLTFVDNFGDTHADMNSDADWSKHSGTATIQEGGGVAFSISAGFGQTITTYLCDNDRLIHQRHVQCRVKLFEPSTRAGIYVSARGVTLRNTYALYMVRSGLNDQFFSRHTQGGLPILTNHGTLTGHTQRTLLIKKRQGNAGFVDIDVDNGALTASVNTGGDTGSQNDASGLYYHGPSSTLSPFTAKAEWDDFKTYILPYR